MRRMLLLHGFTGCGEAMSPLVEALGKGVECECPNLPGHGNWWDPEAEMDFSVEGAAEALHSAEAEILVGYSMGARVALRLALHRPGCFSRLVLIGGTAGNQDTQEREARRVSDDKLAAKIRERGIQWFVNHWGSLPMWESQKGLPGPVKMAQRWLRLSNHAEGLARSLEGMGQGVMEPLWDRLSELVLPVDLVVGSLDEKFQRIAERMEKLLPNGLLHVIEGAGHAAHLECPEEVAAILRAERH